MKLAVMQPYFLPYLGYFQVMNAVDKYVVYDDVAFIKRGRINRNFMLDNGKAIQFNLFLYKASQNKLINEITLLDSMYEREKLLKSFFYCYNKAPNFNVVYPMLERMLNNKEKNLAFFIYETFLEICQYLEIKTQLILSSSIEKNNSLKGEEKIYAICKELGATDYYNSIGGFELYSRPEFEKRGLRLHFLKMNENIAYKQYKNEFIPNLSIVDVLMFNNVEKTKNLLNDYTLL